MPTPLKFNASRHKADKATSASVWIGVGVGGGLGLILLGIIAYLWHRKAQAMLKPPQPSGSK